MEEINSDLAQVAVDPSVIQTPPCHGSPAIPSGSSEVTGHFWD